MAIDFNKIRERAKASQKLKTDNRQNPVVNENQEVDVDKLYELGCNYYFGKDDYEENHEKAYQYFKQGSDLGDLWATGALGRMYMYGHYVAKDVNQAKKLLTSAANENISFAQNCLGDICADEEEDYVSALRWYKSSSEQDNPYGSYKCGFLYYYGLGVGEDEEIALSYFLKAADDDMAESYFYIGQIYCNKEDYQKAFMWFEKSAEAGYYSGMDGLGGLYYFGDGVETDYKEAYKWLSQAAEGNNADACFLVGHMYEFGNGVSASHSKAMSYYRKAAELNDDRAQEAVMYSGWGNVPQNKDSTYDDNDYSSSDSGISYNGDVASSVKAIIADKLGVEEYEITEDASFTNDLGADSLDVVELIMEIEKVFNITVPDSEAEGIRTVGDAIRAIEYRVS